MAINPPYTKQHAFTQADRYAFALRKDIDYNNISMPELKRQNEDRELDLQSKIFKFTDENNQANKFVVNAETLTNPSGDYLQVTIQNYNKKTFIHWIKEENQWKFIKNDDFKNFNVILSKREAFNHAENWAKELMKNINNIDTLKKSDYQQTEKSVDFTDDNHQENKFIVKVGTISFNKSTVLPEISIINKNENKELVYTKENKWNKRIVSPYFFNGIY